MSLTTLNYTDKRTCNTSYKIYIYILEVHTTSTMHELMISHHSQQSKVSYIGGDLKINFSPYLLRNSTLSVCILRK